MSVYGSSRIVDAVRMTDLPYHDFEFVSLLRVDFGHHLHRTVGDRRREVAVVQPLAVLRDQRVLVTESCFKCKVDYNAMLRIPVNHKVSRDGVLLL